MTRVMSCFSNEPKGRREAPFQWACSLQHGGGQAEIEVNSPQKRGDGSRGGSPGALCPASNCA